jgi:hypothetical protein
VGGEEYVQSNCLGNPPSGVQKGVTWPHGSLGSFAVQGNHEMYARALGFFNTFLPTLGVKDPSSGNLSGQKSGFLTMENAYWRVILLDTGFGTYSIIPNNNDKKDDTQPQLIIDWLINEVNIGNVSDTRGIIFMTHHQAETAFEAPWQATPQQIAPLLPPGRTVLWLYGHEHRLAFYKMLTLPGDNPLNIYGRCVGNGGFPGSVGDIPARAKEAGLQAYDDRIYKLETGFFNQNVSFNGWTYMTFLKNTVTLSYASFSLSNGGIDPSASTELARELFSVDESGNVALSNFAILDPEMTVVN